MGLDMYLYADKYLSGWDLDPDPEYKMLAEQFGVEEVLSANAPHANLSFCVAYWRKANATHGWFVENIQGGKDDCQSHVVSREELKELRDTCRKALDSYQDGAEDEAEELLSPTRGFFFGSSSIDEFYADELRWTIDQLDKVLNSEALEDFGFSYRASW